ncbi:MAG: outer membrane beta-barrel protein, partial [Sediminibacterium sp.]|nr:outer membrane beta-barrel protein [Sediminibacterium sp.]
IKLLLSIIIFIFCFKSNGQLKQPKTTPPKINYDQLKKVAADHLILEFGYDGWVGTNDSINPSGFNNHFNIAFMLNSFIKSNPKFSLAYGLGFNINTASFNNTYIDLKSNQPKLPFNKLDSLENRFNVYTLTNSSLVIPVELRYYSDPTNPNKSWKFALGAKVGINLSSTTTGVNLKTAFGSSIYGQNYVATETSSKFINDINVEVTGRFGWGFFGIQGAYLVTDIFKAGATPNINRFSIGIYVSGL